ncbi:MAG: type IX secretion system sortase PorU, partial [Bacteroidota bacterium]
RDDPVGLQPELRLTTFNDYVFHEEERENVLKSGRTWYGEKFDVQTTYIFEGDKFTFPNISSSDSIYMDVSLMARNTSSSSTFDFSLNSFASSVSIDRAFTNSTSDFGRLGKARLTTISSSPTLNITFTYNKANNPSAVGYLDWFAINLKRDLRMARAQMMFRNAEVSGVGEVAQYLVSNAQFIKEIWQVTSPADVKRVNFDLNQDVASFTLDATDIEEFVAFTGSTFLKPSLTGKVPNQNLHALGIESPIDMIIVVPSFMVNEAEQLADLHRNYSPDPLNVEVVQLGQVYNEFSSGIRDVTAMKMLMKMLYDRAKDNTDDAPKHLLLFGDGSYDNINVSSNNSNLIPTFQSENSLSPTRSFVSDDYFGLLSDDDGESDNDLMEISVGRLTVKNRAEASSVISKIRRYMDTFSSGELQESNQDGAFGSWRNTITLVADDEDNNDHMTNSRSLSTQIESYTKRYNIERVFTDAFQQIATPGGDRYPDVNSAIDRRVRNGAFIINYIGHGGESGWAQERILDIPTILDWDNTNRMPIFMTATCEFTRFDDPLRTSAGELVLLNAAGGGVALLTTTRLVYSGPNFRLNEAFYDALFEAIEKGSITRIGDVYRDTKNRVGSATNYRNFSLIGDPALPMAVPKYDMEITSITDTLDNPIDTLKALGVARVNGVIMNGNVNMSGFDGIVEATVFDRVKIRNTLANDGGNVFTYPTQEDIIYRGIAEVKNGEFTFDFVLPKDIPFITDTTARISLYAFSTTDDAAGFKDELIIGGRDKNALDDGNGPNIELFMNDENFVFGGYTDSEPILLAKIADPNGINTVGTGIGHDISAVLDGDIANTLILNDYYSSDLNTFQSGRVRYPFDELSPGNHTLEFKVWDVHNNSNKSSIDFIVAESEELAIERVLNYPNPFTTNTEFYFEHNQSTEFLNVLIEVFTVTGKLVKTINTVSNTDGFRNEPIPWNGRDDFGDKLATGTYVYKVSVKNQAGDKDMKFEKLVILN